MAAVRNGRSIDTSMGFTPLEGLVMGTRSGDMDPAIVPWLMAMEEMTLHQMNTMLNKHSGLYAISGVSSDMREIIEARDRGRRRAREQPTSIGVVAAVLVRLLAAATRYSKEMFSGVTMSRMEISRCWFSDSSDKSNFPHNRG